MFTEAVSGVLSLAEIYEKRQTISLMLIRAFRLLTEGTSQVSVFGSGGTGKSTLGLFVKGELDTDKRLPSYNETIVSEKFRIKSEHPARLNVPPGQEHRRESTWDELCQDIASGKSSKIINVVSWGYHATMLEKAAISDVDAAATDSDFRSAYIANSIKREIDALNQIVTHIKAAPGKIHMLTLVTKQDLWWHKRYEAKSYYEAGSYNAALEKIKESKGKQNFQHDLFSCALVEQNLRTADSFDIALTASGYDDSLRVANLARFAEALEGLIAK